MSHVDEGSLHAFLDGALGAAEPAEAERVELHLAACADCRAKLEQEARLRDEAAALLGGAVPVAFEMPSFRSIRERADAITAETAGAIADGFADAAPGDGAGAPVGGVGGSDTRARARARRRWSGAILASPFNGLAWAATLVLAVGLGWLINESTGQPELRPIGRMASEARRPEVPAQSGDVAAFASVPQEPEDADVPASAPQESDGADVPASVPPESEGATGSASPRPPPPPAPVERVESGRRARDAVLEQGAGEAAPAMAALDQATGAGITAAPERRARLEAARQPMAPPAAAAAAPPAWRPSTLAEARTVTGDDVAFLRGATVLSTALRESATGLEVRTVQETEAGEVVEVVQRPRAEGDAPDALNALDAPPPAQPAAPPPAPDDAAPPRARADKDQPLGESIDLSVRWRDWVVTISGAVDADRLRELLEELP